MKKKVFVKVLKCVRCGHRWYPRPGKDGQVARPRRCAHCGDPNWDRPRKWTRKG